MTGLKGLLCPLELAFWARVSLLGVMGRSPPAGCGLGCTKRKEEAGVATESGGAETGDSLLHSFPTH